MYKYYTKQFIELIDQHPEDFANEIDEWLNSFRKDESQSQYNYEVVGYVSIKNSVIITIRVFENK